MSRQWGGPPRRRPPWWPQDQPWPPPGGYRWGGRPNFVRRLGCAVLAIFAVVAAFGGVVGALIAGAGGPDRPRGPLPIVALVFIIVVLVVISAGARSMRRIARPLDRLVDAAGRIERGDYSTQVPEEGPPQMRSLAHAFNAMSARLRASDEQRRGSFADVVHELRTPLAVIRAQAEAIADGVHPADREHLEPIIDATKSLEVLVEDLRALALSDAGSLALHREPVDAGELARDVVAAFETQAEAAGVRLAASAPDGLPAVDVDPARIRGALTNVVANAVRHTHADGSISLDVSQQGDRVVIAVADTGEGIAPELLPHVFDRFVRGAGSPGSGLGLAIAHDIVVAHGGSISIKSTVGEGTTVQIALPIAG